jgi:hypothetical protein
MGNPFYKEPELPKKIETCKECEIRRKILQRTRISNLILNSSDLRRFVVF